MNILFQLIYGLMSYKALIKKAHFLSQYGRAKEEPEEKERSTIRMSHA